MGTSNKPIFVATHPRACSTAFERVFMTRRDILHCIHEPFGDAFYFGPERLSRRYENDEEARKKSGFADVTYKDVMDRVLDPAASEVGLSRSPGQEEGNTHTRLTLSLTHSHSLLLSRRGSASSSRTSPTTSCRQTTSRPASPRPSSRGRTATRIATATRPTRPWSRSRCCASSTSPS